MNAPDPIDLVPAGAPDPTCGAVCPRNRYAKCELPLEHKAMEQHGPTHLGRDRQGRWWSW